MATKREDSDTGDHPAEAVEASREAAQGLAQGTERTRKAAERAGERIVDASTRMAERSTAQAVDLGRHSTDQLRSLANVGNKIYRDMTGVSKGDVDVLMQTSARLAKGVQDMSWEMMQFTQQNLRLTMRVANEMLGCRTVEDMMQISSNYVRDSLDTLLQESAKLLELSSSVAAESADPLSPRIHDTMPH
jgi:hypothetical protein